VSKVVSSAKKAGGVAKNTAKRAGAKAKQTVSNARVKAKNTARKATQRARQATVKATRLFRINLANTLTLMNGVAGFLSILASMNAEFGLAAGLILAGVLFDWLDGKAARVFSEESALGAELDSLSDLVTFGVAPAVLVAAIAPSTLAYVAGALFVLSAALRLGRFNVQQMKGVFFGVPTTANGFLLPALVFGSAPAVLFPYYLCVMAFLMNVPFRIKKVL